MLQPIEHGAPPLAGLESSSDDEGLSSPESSPALEDVRTQSSASKDGADVTTACNDIPVQETSAANPINDEAVIRARAYQVEMFEKSLEQNIIVAVCRVS